MSLNPENLQQSAPQSPRSVVKSLAICTLVVTLVGLAISVACGIIVALGWKSLRAGDGDEGTFGTIIISTGVSHASYWLTVGLSILLYAATLLLKYRKPKDPSKRTPKKKSWRAQQSV